MFYSEKSIHRKLRTQQFVQKVNKKMETAQPKTDVDAHTKKILAVRALIRERDAARNAADFGKSDTLRDRLKSEFDVIIFDQNGGPSGWKFKDGSSKKLPPGLLEQELPGAIKRKRDESDNSAKKQKTTTDQPKLKGTGHKAANSLYDFCGYLFRFCIVCIS